MAVPSANNTTNRQAQVLPPTSVDCRPKCGSVITTLLIVSIHYPVGNLWMVGGVPSESVGGWRWRQLLLLLLIVMVVSVYFYGTYDVMHLYWTDKIVHIDNICPAVARIVCCRSDPLVLAIFREISPRTKFQ